MYTWLRSLSRKTKIGVAAIIAVLLLAWGAWGTYAYLNRVPGKQEVRAAIEHALTTPSQRLVDASTKLLSDSGGDTANFQFSATLETVEPLYVEVAVSRYLSEIGADAGVYDRIRQILAGPGSDWIRSDAGQTTDINSVAGFVLIRESTKVHTRFTATGDLQAHRAVKAWEIPVANVRLQAAPVGSPRSRFTGNVLLLDRPDDVSRFKASLADAQAALTKLEQSRQKYQEKLVKEDADRRQALLAKLAPGTLFNGTASQGTNTPQPLWLEVTDMDPDRKTLRALLRNDGGWEEARRFEGTFDLDTAKIQVSVILKTDSSQLLQACGPFLEWNENYQFSLKLDGDSLAGTVGGWLLRFARLADDAKKQAEIAFVKDNATKWLATTNAGTVYRLTASLPDRAWSEEYFFSFTKQEKEGLVIEGVLELPGRGLSRKFTGTLITNKYKADRKPLRLLTRGADTVKQAHESSPLAYAGDFFWYPQLDNGRMRIDETPGRFWRVEFAPATVEELVKARIALVVPEPATAVPPTTRRAVVEAAAPAKPVNALPTFPEQAGYFILIDGKWVTLPLAAAAFRGKSIPVPPADITAALRASPASPAKIAYTLWRCDSAPPVVMDKMPTILVRGTLSNMKLPGDIVVSHPYLPLIQVQPDGDKQWRLYEVVLPQTGQHGVDKDTPAHVEDKDAETHVMTITKELAPGFYFIRGAMFEVRDAKAGAAMEK